MAAWLISKMVFILVSGIKLWTSTGMLMIHGRLLVYQMMGNSLVGVVHCRYPSVQQPQHLLAALHGSKSDSISVVLCFAAMADDGSPIQAER